VDASGAPLQIRGSAIGNGLCWKAISGVSAAISQSQTDVEMVSLILWGPRMLRSFYTTGARISCLRRTLIALKKTDSTPSGSHCIANTSRPTTTGLQLIDLLSKWCREDHIYIILMLESGIGGFTGEASDDGPGYPWLLMDAGMQKYCKRSLATDCEPL